MVQSRLRDSQYQLQNTGVCMYACARTYVCTYAYMYIHKFTYICMCVCEVNSCQFTGIRFLQFWWVKKFGGLTGYSLVLVHYIGTGILWQIKRFGG